MVNREEIEMLLKDGALQKFNRISETPYGKYGPCLIKVENYFVGLMAADDELRVTNLAQAIIQERIESAMSQFRDIVVKHELSLIIPTKEEKELLFRKLHGTYVSEFNKATYDPNDHEFGATWYNAEGLTKILRTEIRTHFSLANFIKVIYGKMSFANVREIFMYLSEPEAQFYRSLESDFNKLILHAKIAWLKSEILTLQDDRPRPLVTFESRLNENQISKLYALVQGLGFFRTEFSISDWKDILVCNVSTPHEVCNLQGVAALFDLLAPNFITKTWQNVIEKNHLFVGKRGAATTAKALSTSVQLYDHNSDNYKKMVKVVKEL